MGFKSKGNTWCIMGKSSRKGDESKMTPKELDFIWRLNDYINTLDLFAWSDVGILDAGESLSVLAMPGGEENIYMDGTRDRHLNVQINAKSKNQLNCIESLSLIARKLENLPERAIKSDNDSFNFQKVTITSPLNIVAHDEQGYFIYALSISAKITIYEGVELVG